MFNFSFKRVVSFVFSLMFLSCIKIYADKAFIVINADLFPHSLYANSPCCRSFSIEMFEEENGKLKGNTRYVDFDSDNKLGVEAKKFYESLFLFIRGRRRLKLETSSYVIKILNNSREPNNFASVLCGFLTGKTIRDFNCNDLYYLSEFVTDISTNGRKYK